MTSSALMYSCSRLWDSCSKKGLIRSLLYYWEYFSQSCVNRTESVHGTLRFPAWHAGSRKAYFPANTMICMSKVKEKYRKIPNSNSNIFLWFRINCSRNWEYFDQSCVNRTESVHGTLRFPVFISLFVWNICEISFMNRYIWKSNNEQDTIDWRYTERGQL